MWAGGCTNSVCCILNCRNTQCWPLVNLWALLCCVTLNAMCSVQVKMTWPDSCRLQDVVLWVQHGMLCWCWFFFVCVCLCLVICQTNSFFFFLFLNLLFSGMYIDNWCHLDVKTDWFKKSLWTSHPLITDSPRFTCECLCPLFEGNQTSMSSVTWNTPHTGASIGNHHPLMHQIVYVDAVQRWGHTVHIDVD